MSATWSALWYLHLASVSEHRRILGQLAESQEAPAAKGKLLAPQNINSKKGGSPEVVYRSTQCTTCVMLVNQNPVSISESRTEFQSLSWIWLTPGLARIQPLKNKDTSSIQRSQKLCACCLLTCLTFTSWSMSVKLLRISCTSRGLHGAELSSRPKWPMSSKVLRSIRSFSAVSRDESCPSVSNSHPRHWNQYAKWESRWRGDVSGGLRHNSARVLQTQLTTNKWHYCWNTLEW